MEEEKRDKERINEETTPYSNFQEKSLASSLRGSSLKTQDKIKIFRSYKNLLAPKAEDYYAVNGMTPHPPN